MRCEARLHLGRQGCVPRGSAHGTPQNRAPVNVFPAAVGVGEERRPRVVLGARRELSEHVEGGRQGLLEVARDHGPRVRCVGLVPQAEGRSRRVEWGDGVFTAAVHQPHQQVAPYPRHFAQLGQERQKKEK